MHRTSRSADIELRVEHRQALRGHAVQLLKLGHGSLDAASFADSEEEDITGKLKESIEAIIERDLNAPGWVDRYTVYDEEKPTGTLKLSKRRPRIDITIKRRWKLREPHPRFRFEAKRLRADKRCSAYFGKEGIGCFLRGVYPLTHPDAGMVGYVQAGSLGEWQQRLGSYAKRQAGRLRIVSGGGWRDYPCALPSSSITEHLHPVFPKLTIIHLLLGFCLKATTVAASVRQ
jgi:hypothetical protein